MFPPLNQLRLRNIFSPTNPEQGTIDPNSVDPQLLSQLMQQYQSQSSDSVNTEAANIPPEQYRPKSEVSDLYRKLLMNPPTDQPISKMRRLAGVVSGGLLSGTSVGSTHPELGINIGQEVTNYPNIKSRADYQQRLKELGAGATEEDKYNINQRLLSLGLGSQELRGRQLDISQQRADAYEFSKTHPNWKPFVQSGGNLFYINPQDPTQKYDTGLDTGKLTDADKTELLNSGRLAVVERQSEKAKELELLKQTGRETNIGLVGEQQRKNIEARAEKPETPVQTRVRQFTKAQQVYNAHPEWKKYIQLNVDGPNTFRINPPSKGFLGSGGTDEETFHKIYQAIYGPTEEERVTVYDLSGKAIATIPKADVSKLDKTKYKTEK